MDSTIIPDHIPSGKTSQQGYPSDDDWELHRETITQLYFKEDKRLKDVRDIMRQLFNFKARYAVSLLTFKPTETNSTNLAQREHVQEAFQAVARRQVLHRR